MDFILNEATFIRRNSRYWKEADELVRGKHVRDPDKLATYFIRVNDDLAYARTYYPGSQTVKALNQLAVKLHQKINIAKKYNWRRIYQFFLYHYPLLMHKYRFFLLYSFLIFAISAIWGALSASGDQNFVRLIMGDGYVDMTLANIEKGDPMGVYAKTSEGHMFIQITINNIRVALLTFGAGILATLGTGFILFQNGIMLGAFQYFCYEQEVLRESLMAVWMHGTLEIFSIVVAGAAGMVLGNGWLFPGSLPRKESLKIAALHGVKMASGLIPFFIIAGFIESYLTRHAHTETLSIIIIMLSITGILTYFFIYPFWLKNKTMKARKEQGANF